LFQNQSLAGIMFQQINLLLKALHKI
jgi:hypothetical protein